MATNSSGTLSLLVFLGMTIIFFVIKYNLSQSNNIKLYSIIYYLAVIVSQYFINLNVITQKCGSTNWYLAFIVTLIPWIIIFGLLNIMLVQFPGWKAPFSNTIGYAIVNLAGAKNLLIDHILKSNFVNELSKTPTTGEGPMEMGSVESHPQERAAMTGGRGRYGGAPRNENIKLASEAVQHIYSDPSLLINEVTPSTFGKFWNGMQPLFKSNAGDHKNALYKLIELKDIVSEGVWYLLTGSLITSISYNYITTSKCDIDASEMQKRHDEYENTLKKEQENPETKTVYQITQ